MELDIGINAEGVTLSALFDCCEDIIDAVGRPPHSSGYGFGVRDMQWEMKNKEEYDKALSVIRKVVAECNLTLDYPEVE